MFESLKNTLLIIVVSATTLLLIMPLQAALKDPTRPPAIRVTTSTPPEIRPPRWMLKSTLLSAQRRTAIINDTVVSRGDRINGATVVSIHPSRVRLRTGGQDITLIMLKKNIKSLSRMSSSIQGK